MVKLLFGSAILLLTTGAISEHAMIENPASRYCTDQGGFFELKGSVGICKFMELLKDEEGRYYVQKSECEEWAFFRNQCRKGECEKWHYDGSNSYCERPIGN